MGGRGQSVIRRNESSTMGKLERSGKENALIIPLAYSWLNRVESSAPAQLTGS